MLLRVLWPSHSPPEERPQNGVALTNGVRAAHVIAGNVQVHHTLREPYGESYRENDVIGCWLHLPPGGRPFTKTIAVPPPPPPAPFPRSAFAPAPSFKQRRHRGTSMCRSPEGVVGAIGALQRPVDQGICQAQRTRRLGRVRVKIAEALCCLWCQVSPFVQAHQ